MKAIVLAVVVSQLPGWPLYDRMCLPCHGERGDGHGPAAPWLNVPPRDFTSGAMTWGASDDELGATIRLGVPGLMPAFVLTNDEVTQVIAVLRGFGVAATKPKRALAGGGGDAGRGAAMWSKAGCVGCHGDGGAGTIPAAFDLTTSPLRRPHARGGEDDAIARTIAGGGGVMPGYDGVVSDGDVRDLVAYVDTLRFRGDPSRDLDAKLIAADRTVGATWPASGDDAIVFGAAIAPQGAPPSSLAPAEASLSSRRCGRCHAKQVREWTGSIHGAAISPGFRAQLTLEQDPAPCLQCHAPLAEQAADPDLRAEGVTCAGCHVRGWTRHGPEGVAPSLLTLPSYPFTPLPIYQRSDLCLACHQLPARLAVDGRPLLDTYREWMNGPYMRRGVQCQSCHMPNREHQFLGVHDRETFRQGIRVEAIAARGADGVVSVRARLWNQGAGHMLPTTATPAAWLSIELVDARGRAIAGAHATQRIGRAIRFAHGQFEELEDTRVPPGGSIEVAGGWKHGRVDQAARVHVTVTVSPDEYYENLYRTRLKGKLDDDTRAQYQAALDRAEGDHYVAEDFTVEIPLGRRGVAASAQRERLPAGATPAPAEK